MIERNEVPIEDVTLGEVYRLVDAQGRTLDRLAEAFAELRSSLTKEMQNSLAAQETAQAEQMRALDGRVQVLERQSADVKLLRSIVFGAVSVILLAVISGLIALVVVKP